jgi:unsaturated chondroitin disaccharide hydrolase
LKIIGTSHIRAASPTPQSGKGELDRAFEICIGKARGNIKRLADHPKSGAWAVDGNYFGFREGFFEIGNWTSSFFTGMALLAWNQTEDEFYLEQVLRLLPQYRSKVFDPGHVLDTHHDLGFLYSLYSVALYKLTGASTHRDIAVQAAEVLARRFNEKGNFIRAWGRMDSHEYENMAIIDCLMNLPLLYWASLETGDNRYRDIAARHADTALKCFVRADDSVYHAYRFDLITGRPLRGDTYGGCAVESHWARGAAWAIYGFALSYRHTRDQKYLDAAVRVGHKFIACLDSEIVPPWDFRLPVNGHRAIRDASAASIAVCGFQELAKHGAADASILKAKGMLLARLCSEDYFDSTLGCPGLQKCGQVGDGKGMGKNAYTSWGDYYLMEALARELFDFEGWW